MTSGLRRPAVVLGMLLAVGAGVAVATREGGGDGDGGGDAAGAAGCSVAVTDARALELAVGDAAPGTTVCVAAGRYGPVRLGGEHHDWVRVRGSGPGRAVLQRLELAGGTQSLDVQDLDVEGPVLIGDGARRLRIAHMRVNRLEIRAGTQDVLIERNTFDGAHGNALMVLGTSDGRDATAVRDVTIRQNLFDRPRVDAIMASNYRGLVVTRNEFVGLTESGGHSDVIQSVNGGRGLRFAHNYVHDLEGQGVFVRDGLAHDVVVHENLIVRNRGGNTMQLDGLVGARITRNTVWANASGVALLGQANKGIVMTRNVLDYLDVSDADENSDEDPSNTYLSDARLDERCNVLGGGWSWSEADRAGRGDAVYTPATRGELAERFRAPTGKGGDDWRLPAAAAPCGGDVGVSWVPGAWPVGV